MYNSKESSDNKVNDTDIDNGITMRVANRVSKQKTEKQICKVKQINSPWYSIRDWNLLRIINTLIAEGNCSFLVNTGFNLIIAYLDSCWFLYNAMNDNIFLLYNHLAFESINRFAFPEEQYLELVGVIIIILCMILTLFLVKMIQISWATWIVNDFDIDVCGPQSTWIP